MSEASITISQVEIDREAELAKPRLEAILFFDFANQTTNAKTNLIGIFDRIVVPEGSGKTPHFGLFVRTARTIGGVIHINITAPNGRSVGGVVYEVRTKEGNPEDYLHAQLLAQVAFDTPAAGFYWFAVFYNDVLIGGTGITVEYQEGGEDGTHYTAGNS